MPSAAWLAAGLLLGVLLGVAAAVFVAATWLSRVLSGATR